MGRNRIFAKGDVIRVRKGIKLKQELTMAKNSLAFYQKKLPNEYRVKEIDECCGFPSLTIEPITEGEVLDAHIKHEQRCIREVYFIKVGKKE